MIRKIISSLTSVWNYLIEKSQARTQSFDRVSSAINKRYLRDVLPVEEAIEGVRKWKCV